MNTDIKDRVSEWESSGYENSPEGALTFMRQSMHFFHLRPKGTRIKSLAFMYWSYRNGIVDITPGELQSLARYEGVAVDNNCLQAVESSRPQSRA